MPKTRQGKVVSEEEQDECKQAYFQSPHKRSAEQDVSSLCAIGSGIGRWKSCRHVAVDIIWKFKLTFRPGNYFGNFQIGL